MSSAIEHFREDMRSAGLEPPPVIEADGKLHRFATNSKPYDQAGWYIFYGDGIPAGSFGDWRTDHSQKWRANDRVYSNVEEAEHRERVDAMRREREAAEQQRLAEARDRAAAIWNAAQPAPYDAPYLRAKNVNSYGLRLYDGQLLVPMCDAEDAIHSLQFIDSNGGKRFLHGGRVRGCFFVIGKLDGVLCIAEGYATAASIHAATGYAVAVAFNAGNLEPVARALQTNLPQTKLIVCGDDDRQTDGNPGITNATNAARAVDGVLATPTFTPDEIATFDKQNGKPPSDFNDMAALRGLDAVKQAIEASQPPDAGSASQGDDSVSSGHYNTDGQAGANADSSSSGGASQSSGASEQARGSKSGFKFYSAAELKNLPPLEWLLSDLLVAGSLAVLYGPPGVGKSFLALDLALSISTNTAGVAEPVACGQVVYVAAEGIGGLSKRVEAWENAHGRKAADIHFLPEAVNLIDKADTDKLIASIRGLPTPPLLIVIDTMARCLSGNDENSAKDVGQFVTMIDAVRAAFKCAVLVVHHGTKSSPKTERGSSALRGAADTMLFLDSYFSALTLSCEKQKDAPEFESLSLRLESVGLASGDTSCVMRSADGDATGPGTSPNEHGKVILELLEAIGECGHTDLETRFCERTGFSAATFARALKRLKASGSIKKTEAGKYVLA